MLGTTRRRRGATAALISLAVAGLGASVGAREAAGIATNIHVANTGGDGVNIRTGTNTASPKVGWMPEGASPDYNCYEWGERINGVPIWFNVNWNGVTGFYASYFDDSHYSSDQDLQSRYGVPRCGQGQPAPPPSASGQSPPVNAPTQTAPPSSSSGSSQGGDAPGSSPLVSHPERTSVFFSPIPSVPSGLPDVEAVADLDVPREAWAPGNCDITLASGNGLVTPAVRTLAGWSIGRLGPMYFLAGASDARKSQIQNIILFDPGSQANMEEAPACDAQLRPSVNDLLAQWLSSSDQHHLLVLTGHDSEEHTRWFWGRSTFAGLWKYYFAGIWNKDFADRALVCDYNNMGHEDVLRTFAGVVKLPPAGCPIAVGKPLPVAWHP